eukprot:CAMPEP_0185269284 /NCGR_PEP_ID=MMETSP1359-20130426/39353_1 /TAXON_ID=552665 /ORGANISM="Bigelowiella longifila, Strain CCMP242" /LENGTH=281 /DNA_ID=CAMNT_0027860381 /DNA_START=230 /DNA_END=1072 /DNA_ORIENTATION=-
MCARLAPSCCNSPLATTHTVRGRAFPPSKKLGFRGHRGGKSQDTLTTARRVSSISAAPATASCASSPVQSPLKERNLRLRRLSGSSDDIHKNARFLAEMFFGDKLSSLDVNTDDEDTKRTLDLALDFIKNITEKGLTRFFTDSYEAKGKALEEIREARGFGLRLKESAIERLNGKRRFHVLVIEDENDRIIGTVTAAKTDPDPLPSPLIWKANDDQFYVSNLAISQPFRRKGIAKCLLRATETLAHRWGCNSIWLHVEEDNAPALNLYRRNGYEQRGKDPW